MSRLVVTSASAVALIFFVAFIVARLLRSRSRGFSIRMQFFLALASIVGAFALGLGLLVLDRLEARTTLIAEGAARDEAEAIAALVGSEMDARDVPLDEVGRKYAAARGSSGAGGAERGLTLLDQAGREVFKSGLAPNEPSTVFVSAPIIVRGAQAGSVRVVKRTIVIRRALEDMAPFILTVSIVLGVTAALAADFIGRRIARPIEALTDFRRPRERGRAPRGAAAAGLRARGAEPDGGHRLHAPAARRAPLRGDVRGRSVARSSKNPVAAIRASAEVLADGALEEPEAAMRFVARIQEATTRIEALLGDLLSLARIEARGLEGAAPLDLGDLARQAVERAKERGAEVGFAIATEPGVTVRGDPLWLARAVDNLLENGRIHGQAGSKVEVEVARRGEQVVLAVRNEGEIGKHVEKRLFRRFVTTRADRGGTGLGLAIVRAIAEAHSGSAECASAGPPRVEFRISLPAA
ncbi:MAG: ATP-binding protein [Minicystis sp.]